MLDSALYYVGEGVIGTLLLFGAVRFWRSRKTSKSQSDYMTSAVQEIFVRREEHQPTDLQLVPKAISQLEPQHNCFALGNPDNPTLKVIAWESSRQLPKTLKASTISGSHLDALIQPTIKLIDSVRQTPIKTLEIFFAPDVLQQLSSGTAHLMPAVQEGFHVTAVNNAGSIIGQGWMKVVTRIDWSQVAFGVWQALTIVTQQKHLSSIDKRLQNVEGKLDELKNWLEQSEFAKIYGNYDYLQTLVSTIANQRYKEVEVQTLDIKLEDVCHTIYELLPHLKEQMQGVAKKIDEQRLTGAGFNDHKDILIKLMSEFSMLASYYTAALQVAEMVIQMKCALPLDRHLSDSRLDDLSLKMEDHAKRINNFQGSIEGRVNDLSDVYKKMPLVNKLPAIKDGEKYRIGREEVLNHLKNEVSEMNQDLCLVQTITGEVQGQLMSKATKPTRLLVTINEQRQVSEVRQFSDD